MQEQDGELALVCTWWKQHKWEAMLICSKVYHLLRHGVLQMQKFKNHMLRTQSSKVLPLKSGEGQYNAKQTSPTARDFFPANFYHTGPFAYIFSKTSPKFFLF